MTNKLFEKGSPVRFLLIFISLFVVFYYFNIFFFSITSPNGNHYIPFFDEHLNYIRLLRHILLKTSAHILGWLGFTAITSDIELLVAGRGSIQLVYTCLGLGIMSFFTAFVIAYPKKLRPKLMFLICGLIVIQLLNIIRFLLLALFGKGTRGIILDHHTIFNILIYIIIAVSLYIWIKHDDTKSAGNAAN